jgi:hypothetical protein
MSPPHSGPPRPCSMGESTEYASWHVRSREAVQRAAEALSWA